MDIDGTLKTFSSIGGSGNPILRHFCPECGSSIAEEPGARPGMIILNAGTFDDPSVVKNRSHHARVLPQEGWPAIFFSDNADDVTVVIDHRYCADFVVEQCVPNSKKKTLISRSRVRIPTGSLVLDCSAEHAFGLVVTLILRAKSVIAARRYDKGGKIVALDASRHPHEALSQAG